VIFTGMPPAAEQALALEGAQGWIDKNRPLWETWYMLRTLLEQV
jgi:hypothetical protein